jgi:hypothetical protein
MFLCFDLVHVPAVPPACRTATGASACTSCNAGSYCSASGLSRPYRHNYYPPFSSNSKFSDMHTMIDFDFSGTCIYDLAAVFWRQARRRQTRAHYARPDPTRPRVSCVQPIVLLFSRHNSSQQREGEVPQVRSESA